MICNLGDRGPTCTLHAEGIAYNVGSQAILRVLIRWRILALLFAFSFIGYVRRTRVSIWGSSSQCSSNLRERWSASRVRASLTALPAPVHSARRTSPKL